MTTKYKIGYTQGVYDLFHVGHLNLLNNAKTYCEYLLVGVNPDALVERYKHKTPLVKEDNRLFIVANIKAVDKCVIVDTLDKTEIYQKYKFDVVFIGDDWRGNERWVQTERDLAKFAVPVIYLPHTPSISSTSLRTKSDEYIYDFHILKHGYI